jgi:hypothetical protein
MRSDTLSISVRHRVPSALGAAAAAMALTLALAAASLGATDGHATVAPPKATDIALRSGTIDAGAPQITLAAAIAQTVKGKRWIVQLDGPMTPERRAAVAAAGITLETYIPVNGWIARLDGADAAKATALTFVRWVGPYDNAWKADRALGAPAAAFTTPERQALAANNLELVLVTLFADESPAGVTSAIAKLGPAAKVHWSRPTGGNVVVSATIPRGSAQALAARADVAYIEPAPELTERNNENRWIIQTNVPNSTPFYGAGIHGEGQILGLLDTRVDMFHCSFNDPDHPIGPLHRKILAYNRDFTVGASHGTHVAGIAVGDNGIDNDTRGVAYLAKLVYAGIPSFTETSVYDAFSLHESQGARVHTNSWGDDSTTAYNSLCRGIDSFLYDHETSLVLFAVTNTTTLKNPENAKNLLACAATNPAPNQDQFCHGGSGPTSDGRRKPEVYAPGCNTISSRTSTPCDTIAMSGTSMATPVIAGAGLLARQYFMEGRYPTGVVTPANAFEPSGALLKAVLVNSAQDMTGLAGYPGPVEGWGRVRLDGGLYLPGDVTTTIVRDVRNASGLYTGQQTDVVVNVQPGQPLHVTLAWTDPPAAANAAFAPINNLDLVVIPPDGNPAYLGNDFASGESVRGGSPDSLNNLEQVIVNEPVAGLWTVRVAGTGVNVNAQGYALVVTGGVGEPCISDWDLNGVVNSTDVSMFINDWFTDQVNGTLVTDFNGDGVSNSTDVSDFINQWFADIGGC